MQLLPAKANNYAVTDFCHFTEAYCQQDLNLYMANLDVDSVFTNLPLDETIDIRIDNFYNVSENLPNIPKHSFCNLLNIASKEYFFTFKSK